MKLVLLGRLEEGNHGQVPSLARGANELCLETRQCPRLYGKLISLGSKWEWRGQSGTLCSLYTSVISLTSTAPGNCVSDCLDKPF